MAVIDVRGYVHKPQAKSGKKSFSTFGLNVTQKNKVNGEFQKSYAYYQVTDWNRPEPPPEKAFVTVKGYLNVREYEKDGQKRQSLDINCTDLEVSPPRDTAPNSSATASDKDPWED